MASASPAIGLSSGAPPSTSLRGLFVPPRGLLQRTRWLFLAAFTLVLVGVGLQGVSAAAAAGGAWPVALVGSIGLLAVWLHGYTRGRYTLGHDIAGVALVLAVAAVTPVPQVPQWLLVGTLWLRVLHADGRAALIAGALCTAATAVAALLTPGELAMGQAISRLVLLPVGGAAIFLIGAALGGYERSIARERRLREAGAKLVAATDRPSIYAATLAGARALLGETRGVGVELAIGSGTELEVVAEEGRGVGAPGGRVDLAGLPEALRVELVAGRPAEVAHADAALWRALDLEPRRGTVYALPLAGQGTLDGALVVGSDRPLDRELKDDLETLADLAALTVESQLVIEARASGTALPPTRRVAVDSAAGADAEERSLLRLPRELPARVRWLFLAAVSLMALWIPLSTVLPTPRASLPWAVAATAPLWLIGWWAYGHRRRAFPLVGDFVVGALLALAMMLQGDPAGTLVYISMWFRSVYGTRASVARAFVVHAVALLAAEALAPTGDTPIELAVQVAELAAIAGLVHFVCWTLARSERAMARERALRDAGRALVVADDGPVIYGATIGAARRLLEGTAGAAATLVVGSAAEMRVVAGEDGPADRVRLDALPESLRTSLLAGEPAELASADEATWRALDMPARAGGLYALPLRARGELEGALVVAADGPLDAELKDDLQTLADLAALAVEGMELRATGQPG